MQINPGWQSGTGIAQAQAKRKREIGAGGLSGQCDLLDTRQRPPKSFDILKPCRPDMLWCQAVIRQEYFFKSTGLHQARSKTAMRGWRAEDKTTAVYIDQQGSCSTICTVIVYFQPGNTAQRDTSRTALRRQNRRSRQQGIEKAELCRMFNVTQQRTLQAQAHLEQAREWTVHTAMLALATASAEGAKRQAPCRR